MLWMSMGRIILIEVLGLGCIVAGPHTFYCTSSHWHTFYGTSSHWIAAASTSGRSHVVALGMALSAA